MPLRRAVSHDAINVTVYISLHICEVTVYISVFELCVRPSIYLMQRRHREGFVLRQSLGREKSNTRSPSAQNSTIRSVVRFFRFRPSHTPPEMCLRVFPIVVVCRLPLASLLASFFMSELLAK